MKKHLKKKEEESLAEHVMSISDDTFEEDVLKSEIPVLVDFWAAWCGPCHIISPAVEDLAQTYQGEMKVMKMNVDENMKTPSKYGVLSIPTLLLFVNGKIADTIVGAYPKEKIVEVISKYLKKT